MADNNPDEIKTYDVHSIKVFCDAICPSGIMEDRVILYSKAEYDANYTSVTMECFSQGANRLLMREEMDVFRFVGDIQRLNRNCRYNRNKLPRRFTLSQIEYDRDPTLIPTL